MQVNNFLEHNMNGFLTALVIVALVIFAGSTVASAVNGEFSAVTSAMTAAGR
jgi:Flp pilus assembly pilin Flp